MSLRQQLLFLGVQLVHPLISKIPDIVQFRQQILKISCASTTNSLLVLIQLLTVFFEEGECLLRRGKGSTVIFYLRTNLAELQQICDQIEFATQVNGQFELLLRLEGLQVNRW